MAISAPIITTQPSFTSIPALDGMRAVAVSLVIASHMGLQNFVPGGFGVTLFFFISGFLITRLLLAEYTQRGQINIRDFYMRRVLRIMPALLGMVTVGGLCFTAFGGRITLPQWFSVLFYGANYYELYAKYHTNISAIRHPFGILWSLAVEEHFYIFFPALLLFGLRTGKTVLLTTTLIILAVLWRYVLFNHCMPDAGTCGLRGTDYRLYMGSDTRFDSLLYGALLTLLLARDDLAWLHRLIASRKAFIIGLVLLLISFGIRNALFSDVLRTSVQGIGLIPIFAGLMLNPSLITIKNALTQHALLYIGRLSYSLYLYHWVAIMVVEGLAYKGVLPNALPLKLALMAALSLGSYYGIERPILGLRRHFGSHTGKVSTDTALAYKDLQPAHRYNQTAPS